MTLLDCKTESWSKTLHSAMCRSAPVKSGQTNRQTDRQINRQTQYEVM